jgi:diaminobutyrate-2-oxoglutarate transaminase
MERVKSLNNLTEEELLKEGLKRFEIAVDKLIEERSEHLKGEY